MSIYEYLESEISSDLRVDGMFVGDQIRLVVETSITLTGQTGLQINYRKPDGTHGHWDATIVSGSPTQMEHTFSASDIDQPGIWVVQAYVTSLSIHGRWVEFQAYDGIPSEIVPT